MKISIDDVELMTLSETQKKVIKNDIRTEDFDDEVKERIKWVIEHKYHRCLDRLKNEWSSKLKDRYANVPTNDDQLADLIFSQPDYKDRSGRENK